MKLMQSPWTPVTSQSGHRTRCHEVIAERLELKRILLNLALNARDAMAGDGELTIETAVVGDSSSRRMTAGT